MVLNYILSDINDNLLAGIASILASNALISNSTAGVIGSMLISPYLEPVKLFLDTKHPSHLLNLGVLILIVVGYVYHIIYATYFEKNEHLTVSNHDQSEMESRTDGRIGTYINAFIYAFFAGVVLRLNKHSKEITNIIGIGIGASLLPPVVNCGLHFSKNEYEKGVNSLKLSIVNIIAIIVGYMGTNSVYKKI